MLKLLIEFLEARFLPSIGDGAILVATAPSPFSTQDQSTYAIGVIAVDPTTGAQTPIATDGFFILPSYIAEDEAGNLYVSCLTTFGAGAIVKVDPDNGSQSLLATGGFLDGPNAVVFQDGLLYVANGGNGSGDVHNLISIDPNSGNQAFISDVGFTVPVGMTSGPAGYVYVADEPGGYDGRSPGGVWRVNLSTGEQGLVAQDNYINHPCDIARSGDKLIVGSGGTDDHYADIVCVKPDNGSQRLISQDGMLIGGNSLAVAKDGTIYVGCIAYGEQPAQIIAIDPSTGIQTVISIGENLSLVEGIHVYRQW